MYQILIETKLKPEEKQNRKMDEELATCDNFIVLGFFVERKYLKMVGPYTEKALPKSLHVVELSLLLEIFSRDISTRTFYYSYEQLACTLTCSLIVTQ